MRVFVNGEKEDVGVKTVSELLKHLGLDKDMVAVELNKEIVRRQDFDKTKLKDDDRLEIVSVVGGG